MSLTDAPAETSAEKARSLLDDAAAVYGAATDDEEVQHDQEIVAYIQSLRERLDEPFRVGLVGAVKAGKSTLLNALVGEEIAATDARECTKVVTWYTHGPAPRASAWRTGVARRRLRIRRGQGFVRLDLGDMTAEEIDRIEVSWPARRLAQNTLIDTPGTASISRDVSARTWDFLAPENDASGADAVVYLMRSVHSSDVEFLQTLQERTRQGAATLGVVAVLSRADEIGAGRIDAMVSAQQSVARFRDDPVLGGLCSTMVPVAGLLALAGSTLRASEFEAFCVLEKRPRKDISNMLLSADRFTAPISAVPLSQPARIKLIDRFGLFGIRLSIALIRSGVRDAEELSEELQRRSGLEELRRVLHSQFGERTSQLKAHSTLVALQNLLAANPRIGTTPIHEAVEESLADVHTFRELRVLGSLQSADFSLSQERLAELERLVGGFGTSAFERLGVESDTEPESDVRARALALLTHWRATAENPLTDRSTAAVCRVAARSCEGILAQIS